MSTTNNSTGGISFAGLLTIVFVALKLTHVIDWSWWWVVSPLLVSIALALVILAITGIVILCIRASDKRAFKKAVAKRDAREARLAALRTVAAKKW